MFNLGKKRKENFGRTWSDQDLKEFFGSIAEDDRRELEKTGLEEKTAIARQGKNPVSEKAKTNTTPDFGAR